jgi:cytochrome c-type biogenesis protein CcsB
MELTSASYGVKPPFFKTLTWFDWLFALLAGAGGVYTLMRYSGFMDGYEQGILVLAAVSLVALGWMWKPVRPLVLAVAALSLFGTYQYHGDLARGEQAFFLKFLFSSQSAIMWMSALFVMATLGYWIGLFARSEFVNRVSSAITWSAVAMGLVGLMVRWYESYLLGADIGHIPISNLYEVFILFAIITALMYLFYEDRYDNRQMGAFALTVISAAVAFLLWYAFDRQAHGIQPLVPALQSYWMKLHVPANFVGYGAFSLSAMVGVAYLLAEKGILANRLPSLEVLDDVMYKAIAIGFAFFTIATILGAVWAAEAWGSYWSWDPKETWALIVWLNYAAWLHLRLVKGLRGPMAAWWAVIGLVVTVFAFLGVNMFLSGLHSYGSL